jgi:branched-subunit amino acid transport protein
MSTTQLWWLVTAVAAGVILPKALPAAMIGRVAGQWARFLDLLPAATLGALAVLTALGAHDGLHPRIHVVLAASIAVGLGLGVRVGVLGRLGRLIRSDRS